VQAQLLIERIQKIVLRQTAELNVKLPVEREARPMENVDQEAIHPARLQGVDRGRSRGHVRPLMLRGKIKRR
jgi:hypothetical protein